MPQAFGARPAWHDVHVAIQGPAVFDVETTFRERWEDSTPLTLNPGPAAVEPGPARAAGPAPAGRAGAAAAVTGGGRHRGGADPAHLPGDPAQGLRLRTGGGAQRGARQHHGRRARPAAGLPRGPVPVVGGGRPALRQGPAREPRAAAHRGDPDGPRRGRRAHPARRSSTGASWRWTSCSRPGATGSPCTGSPARRATRSTCTPRSASSTTCGPASGPTTSTGARGRATRRSPARCRTCGWRDREAPVAARLVRPAVAPRAGGRAPRRRAGRRAGRPGRGLGPAWRPRPTRWTTWYAGGAGPRGRRHLPRPKAPLKGTSVRWRRRAGAWSGAPGVERPPGRLRRLSPPELTRAQLLWAPRLYDVFDPDGTVLRDDQI